MLVTSRKVGQSIIIEHAGTVAECRVLELFGRTVRIGWLAPPAMGIYRQELYGTDKERYPVPDGPELPQDADVLRRVVSGRIEVLRSRIERLGASERDVDRWRAKLAECGWVLGLLERGIVDAHKL
jgi:carbon storage regulator CsrA